MVGRGIQTTKTSSQNRFNKNVFRAYPGSSHQPRRQNSPPKIQKKCKLGCDERFENNKHRLRHYKRKHKDKLISCEFCKKLFVKKRKWERHMGEQHDVIGWEKRLLVIKTYFEENLGEGKNRKLIEGCDAIQRFCKADKDGCGLSSSLIVDKFLSEFLEDFMPEFQNL